MQEIFNTLNKLHKSDEVVWIEHRIFLQSVKNYDRKGKHDAIQSFP